MFFHKKCYVNTTEGVDAIAITHDLKYAIRDSKSPEGLLTVVVPKAGAGLAIMPRIEDAVGELKTVLDVFGSEAGTAKDRLQRERSLGPILQSAILGRTIHIPFQDAGLLIDGYDEVYLVDFEKKKGRREFVIQIISEAPPAQPGAQAPRGRQAGRR